MQEEYQRRQTQCRSATLSPSRTNRHSERSLRSEALSSIGRVMSDESLFDFYVNVVRKKSAIGL
jgi:hypothetical protein